MTEAAPPCVLLIDLLDRTLEGHWADQLSAMGVTWESSEAHPIHDGVKLFGCRNVPAELPAWLEVKKATKGA